MPRATTLPVPDQYDAPVAPNFCMCPKCAPAERLGPSVQPEVCTGYGYWGNRNWKFGGRGPSFYGMELEMHSPGDRGSIIVHSYLGDAIAEVKPDTGMEVTSHPMSLAWFMRHYPWDMLGRLRREGSCGGSPDTHGLHVHVNKAGFSSPDHIYHWLSTIYASPREMKRLGGRQRGGHFSGVTTPASIRRRAEYWWAVEERKAARHEAALRAKPGGRYAQRFLRPADRDKLRALDLKQRALTVGSGQDRAVNESRHAHTFEVRFPGSSLDASQVKSVIQLVAGTVEYARQLDRDAHAFSDFSGWTAGRRRYRELNDAIGRRL